MKITRRQLRRLVETIYAGPPSAGLERKDDEDGITIKANLATTKVDDDGNVEIVPSQAVVGGDSGDGMQSSLDNIMQGLGTSPEVSQNLAKIIKLFSNGANEIMNGDNASGIETFVQAFNLLESMGYNLNFDGPQLTIFLDALSGHTFEWDLSKANVSPGSAIASEVFEAFRSAILFGELVPRIDEVNALAASGQTGKLDPMFDLIKDTLHPNLFPLFVAGYDDAVNQQGTASLDQFVSLGLANYPAGSYENFMIQILITPYDLAWPASWKGIDYVTNLLIKSMYTSANAIKNVLRYSSNSKVTSRDGLPDSYKTGKSSISLPDEGRKLIDPKAWDKKRRGVNYDIYIKIPAKAAFLEDESFEELSQEVANFVSNQTMEGDDSYWDQHRAARPDEYSEIYRAYEEFYDQANMEKYEDALIKSTLWELLKQKKYALQNIAESEDLEIIKFGVDDSYRNPWEVAPKDIEIHLKYTGSKEGGVSPGEIISKVKDVLLDFAPSTHDATGTINVDFLDKLVDVIDNHRSNTHHEIGDADYDEYNPVDNISFSWVPDGEFVDDYLYDLTTNPKLIATMKPMERQVLDLSDAVEIRVFAQNKSADKIKALKQAEEEKRKQRYKRESISHSHLKTLIKEALFKKRL